MYNTLEVEKKFRDARLITNPQERTTMKGARPNIEIVKEVIYNYKDLRPVVLKNEYNLRTLEKVKYVIRGVIKQYLEKNIWKQLPFDNVAYNSKGSVELIKESFDYLTELFDGNITEMFSFNSTNAGKTKYERKPGSRKTKKTKQLLDIDKKQPIEPLVLIDTRVENSLRKEIGVLLGDINKYSLTKEQIVEQLEKLKRGADD